MDRYSFYKQTRASLGREVCYLSHEYILCRPNSRMAWQLLTLMFLLLDNVDITQFTLHYDTRLQTPRPGSSLLASLLFRGFFFSSVFNIYSVPCAAILFAGSSSTELSAFYDVTFLSGFWIFLFLLIPVDRLCWYFR